MKKRIKISLILISIVVILLGSYSIAFAHPGKTDSAGGHYDRSSGEYHYHHGYPTHHHDNGTCPYDFKNNEKNTESHNYGYDYESINDKYATATTKEPITKKSQLDFISDYEKLEKYYKDARQQISETNTYDTQLYSDFLVLNTQIIHDLPSYKGYMNDNKYEEIQKQTKLYKNFLDNNNPDDLEYIETTTQYEYKTEKTTKKAAKDTSHHLKKSVIEKLNNIFAIVCYCLFGVYIIEVIICVIIIIISEHKNIKTFLGSIDLFLGFIPYLIISILYFLPLFNATNKYYILFLLYIFAPIVSTVILTILIRNVIKKEPISKNAESTNTTDYIKHIPNTNSKGKNNKSESIKSTYRELNQLRDIFDIINYEHSRLSKTLTEYLFINNFDLTPIEYFNIKSQIEDLKEIFPKEYYDFVLQYENPKDLANIPDNYIVFNNTLYKQIDNQFKKQTFMLNDYSKIQRIVKTYNLKLKLNDDNKILDKSNSFYTKLNNVADFSCFSFYNRQEILHSINNKCDYYSIEPYEDFPIHLEPYINHDGKEVFLTILTKTNQDLGEFNIQKSKLLYNNSDHYIKAKIVNITGGTPPKKYGCNIKVTIE